MSQLPTGTVTFLFTDIEGSTRRWDAFPDAMRAALERHDALMREAVESHAGQVFKTVGDAFCVAFATAGAGLAAAIEAQRAIAAEDWSRFGEGFRPILVRMGLHTGEATERGGDYFGQPVNRVARIEAAGNGGQILISAVTREAVSAAGLPAGARLRDLGEFRLKDLRHSERISQVLVEGLPDVTRALRTAGDLSARDRIQVLAPHVADASTGPTVVSRSVTETLDAIEAALRRDSTGAILTSDQVIAAARHKAGDWREWRLGRVAEWSQPRYRLDGRFVGLTLLIDQGEEAVQGRWQAAEERYEDLGELLAATTDPAIVMLGPPGGGKSTLLRRLELDTAIAGLRGEDGAASRVTFFVSLNTYKPSRADEPLPYPAEWLAERWARRSPNLPPLDDLLAEGRVTLLLDALNEMPAAGDSEFREQVRLWKDWLVRLASDQPGNRVVFSCRSLDYSQSLSTPDLRVPQVRIENLTDDQVRDFLMVYSPGRWREIWQAQRETEPAFWHDARFNHPAQPVVGVCWYEARAYGNWLADQTGMGVRLPTEVEWEAAAGGKEGRRFPWVKGDERTRANTIETYIKRTTPVGVFPEGDSPDGVADLGGNAFEWTTTVFGQINEEDIQATDFPYPYDPSDGREEHQAPHDVRRVMRGGGWTDPRTNARAAFRAFNLPDYRGNGYGFRVAVSASPVPNR